ncbi:MAG: single-stranded DNA-binding protein, partial [Defluviitaleaceae bacterium]|nr:single-stranded DNA-binding protein [Defluviitaleaceae bacterium]
CITFRRTAEFMERYIKKGMQISLCGSIQVRQYEDNSGQRKWSTEVVADEVNFAESRAAYEARMAKGGGDPDSLPPAPPQPVSPEFKAITESIDEDDDLPF